MRMIPAEQSQDTQGLLRTIKMPQWHHRRISCLCDLRLSKIFKTLCWLVVFFFCQGMLLPDILRLKNVYAQPLSAAPSASVLPPSPLFSMPVIKGIQVDPQQPFEISFMVASEDVDEISRNEVTRLIQYFLTALTVPEEDLWVNLSPYEKDRVIPEPLSATQAGKDLLIQDHLLKQLTASLTYPETELGKQFWQKVREKAYARYQRTDIPLNTFNKVWIVPERAVIYEVGNMAFIAESRLKVLLEEDYLSRANNRYNATFKTHTLETDDVADISTLSSQIAKEILVPELEREVNDGQYFAPLRQIFHSMILAIWFKQRLRRHVITQLYANKNKIHGIDISDKEVKKRVYEQYLKGFKEGVYDYIRVEHDTHMGKYVPRHYVSGGFDIGSPRTWLRPISITAESIAQKVSYLFPDKTALTKIKLNPITKNIQQEPVVVMKSDRQRSSSPQKSMPTQHPVIPIKTHPKRFSPGAFLRTTFLIFLLSVLPLASLAKQEILQNEISQPPKNELVSRGQAATINENKILRLHQVISAEDQGSLDSIRKNVTIDDVKALNGQINPVTQQAYSIDQEFFEHNSKKIFETPIRKGQAFTWATQVLVVAYQHKHNLQEDGLIGPQVRAHLETGQHIPIIGGGEPPDEVLNNAPSVDHHPTFDDNNDSLAPAEDTVDSAVITSADPKDAMNTQKDRVSPSASFNWKNIAKSLIFILTLSIHFFTLYRNKEKRQLARKEVLLRDLTQYLRGKKTSFVSKNHRNLLPLFTHATDMFSRQINGYIEIVIKASARLPDNHIAQEALRQAMIRLIEQHDIDRATVFSEGNSQEWLLNFMDCEISGRDIILKISTQQQIPAKGTLATKIYFSTHEKPAEVPLVKDSVQELVSYWKNYLAAMRQAETNLSQQDVLHYLEKIKDRVFNFYQVNPIQLSTYNRDQIAAHDHIRELAIETALFVDAHEPFERDPKIQEFKNYFLDLARASNRFHLLMGVLSVVYRFRTFFLPRNDSVIDSQYGNLNLNAQIGPFRFDKWIRLFSGVDYFLAKVIPLGDIYLDQFAFYQDNIKRFHGTSTQESLVERYTKDFYDHIFLRENPRQHSLIGRDNFRRYQSMLGFLATIIAILAPLATLTPLTIVLSIAAVARLGVFHIWLPWHINRLIKKKFNHYENKIDSIDYLSNVETKSQGQKYLHFLKNDEQLKSTKQQLLDYINKNVLLHVTPSYLFRKAVRFFDAYAVMKPGEVRLSFKLDGFLRKNSREGKAAQDFFIQQITRNDIRLELIRHDNTIERVHHDDMQFDAISSRFFINIKRRADLPVFYKKINLVYEKGQSTATIDIDQNIFEILQSFWRHLLQRQPRTEGFANDEEYGFLLELIAGFRSRSLDFNDFRTSAKQWLLIKKLAFETWKRAKDGNLPLPAYADKEYFLELSLCANEARNIMGEFATADTFKGFFYPDDHALGHKYQISVGKFLRGIFASWSFYARSKENALKSIRIFKNYQKSLEQMEEKTLQRITTLSSKERLKRMRCLNGKNGFVNEVQRQCIAFEFPRSRSLATGELFGRLERSWMMLANIMLALAVLFLPAFPFIHDFPIQRVFIVFLAMNYWVLPLQAHTQIGREYLQFKKEVAFEQNQHPSLSTSFFGHHITKMIWSLKGYLFYATFFLGLLYDAVFIFASFLYMQFESLVSQPKNGTNGSSLDHAKTDDHAQPSQNKTSSPALIVAGPTNKNIPGAQEAPGGIDLKISPSQLMIVPGPEQIPTQEPRLIIPNFQGFDFQFLQFQPFINPAAYLQDACRPQLSFKAP